MIGPRYPLTPIGATESFGTLGVLELRSIAQGVLALDAMIKESPIRVATAAAASPGKYLILITGEVEEVSRALARGIEVASEELLDDLLLPHAHSELTQFFSGEDLPSWDENEGRALGILETYGAPSLLGAVDTALKTAETALVDLHLLAGIGGKATAILAGDVESVNVGLAAGAEHAEARDVLAGRVVIPRPDPSLATHLTRRRADG